MDQYVVIPFVTRRGKLQPGKQVATRTPKLAIDEANRITSGGGGAAAIHVVVDEDTGDTASITVLAKVGHLPDDFDQNMGL